VHDAIKQIFTLTELFYESIFENVSDVTALFSDIMADEIESLTELPLQCRYLSAIFAKITRYMRGPQGPTPVRWCISLKDCPAVPGR
jgi:hypothetical protein